MPETLPQMLHRIAEEMEAGDWSRADAAVLIVRDAESYELLTFCEWGDTGELLEEAHRVRGAQA